MADITDPLPLPEPILKDKTPARLPCPDKVPESPMRQSKGPGILDRLWCNKWNLARHFIIQGSIAAGATWEATRSMKAAAIAFVSGGTVGAGRKAIDDVRRSDGKADMITAIFKPKPEGDAMGIRTDVYEVKTELKGLGMVFIDDEPDKDQLDEILGHVLGIVKEGSDFKNIPKAERFKAIAHAFTMAGAELMDEAVKYSDEAAPTA